MRQVPRSRIPSPIQTLWWVLKPISFMHYMRKRFGDTFGARFLIFPPVTMVSDPADVRAVFTAPAGTLNAGEANVVLAPLVGDNSVLLLDGDRHLRQRRLLLPPFHGERMRAYEDEMAAITNAAVDRWRVGEELRLHDVTQQITLEVILRVVFGIRDEARAAAFRERLGVVDPQKIYRVLALAPLQRFARRFIERRLSGFVEAKAQLDELLFAEVAARRDDPEASNYEDILSLLLQARDEDGVALSDQELRDELVTLVVAGHETTATALAWTVELLLRHPEAMRRVREEAVAGESSEYVDAVIAESMRLRPILPMVARRVKEPFSANGLEIPVGETVCPNIYLTQRNPAVYPDPDRFDPERFVGKKPDTYSWLPFGGGIRRCIGASFALVEMRVVLQTLLGRAELRAVRDTPEDIGRRAITLVPVKGVPVVPTKIAA